MRVQHQRTDVLPLTWEIPVTIALGWVVLAVLAMPGGQSLAYAVTGRAFAWPAGELAGSVAGLVDGRPGVGVSERPPGDTIVYAVIAVAEVAVTAVTLWVAAWWWRTTGPGAQYGLASKHEIRTVLGEGPLGRRRKTIRPDLGSVRKR